MLVLCFQLVLIYVALCVRQVLRNHDPCMVIFTHERARLETDSRSASRDRSLHSLKKIAGAGS